MVRGWLPLGVLALVALAYPALPAGSVAQAAGYSTVGMGAIAIAIQGVRLHRPRRRGFWVALLAGLTGLVSGDVTWYVLRLAGGSDGALLDDLLRLVGYLFVVLAVYLLAFGRHRVRDFSGIVDAGIVVTGAAVLTAVLAIEPVAHARGGAFLAPTLACAYPLAGLLLIALLARVWRTSDRRLVAYRAIGAALVFSLVGTTGYAAAELAGSTAPEQPLLDVCFLLGYLCFAAATWHRSMRQLSDPAPDREEPQSRTLLVTLTVASMLAPALLIAEGVRGRAIHWQVVGPGSILLFTLVLVRVAGLLRQVERQAAQLAALARNDGLTGIPNRRTWDHALSRACAGAATTGAPLTVAMLDLDHFKDFNDAAGHGAGDLLLKGATAAWRSALPEDVFLARYGGEEFALLFPGRTAAGAYAELDALRAVTPSGQTFSVGIAAWDGTEEPAAAVARADALLYEAKRGGRDRIRPLPDTVDLTTAVPAPMLATTEPRDTRPHR
jgi:diguanylate cyclase (GGDEF)-like protein